MSEVDEAAGKGMGKDTADRDRGDARDVDVGGMDYEGESVEVDEALQPPRRDDS